MALGPEGTRQARRGPGFLGLGLTLVLALCSGTAGIAATLCTVEQTTPLQPTNRALCAELGEAVRRPRELPLDDYQGKLAEFLRNFCHRDVASGWQRDKHVRDTGPFLGTLKNGKWDSAYHGTHAPVVTWYSPDMVAWLKANRPENHDPA